MKIICTRCGERLETKGNMPAVDAHMATHLGLQPVGTVLRVYTLGHDEPSPAYGRYAHPDEW